MVPDQVVHFVTWKNFDAVVSDQSSPETDNYGKNTMLERLKWIIWCLKSDFQTFSKLNLSFSSFKQIKIPNFRIKKSFQIPAEIRQIDLKPDRNRNRILGPEIRPEPDSAGFPVGS